MSLDLQDLAAYREREDSLQRRLGEEWITTSLSHFLFPLKQNLIHSFCVLLLSGLSGHFASFACVSYVSPRSSEE